MLDEKIDALFWIEEMEARQLRSAFFDEADAAFLLFDAALCLTDVNAGYLKEIQQDRKALLGKSLFSILTEFAEPHFIERISAIINGGESLLTEFVKSHPLKGKYTSKIHVFKVGQGIGVVIKKVPSRKDTVADLESFIYNASHELRGPLARILGVLNISEGSVQDVQEAYHYLKMIRQQAEGLDSILKTLVQSTDIRKIDLSLCEVEMDVLLDHVLNKLRDTQGFDEIWFEKSVKVDAGFISDPNLLQVLLFQLIENAIKFRKRTKSQAIIKVTVSAEGEYIGIVVEDNGQGIPKNIQEKLFQMFFRSGKNQIGTGLGLYTVRQIVKKLEGQISLQSDFGKGAQFSVLLPNRLSTNIKTE